MKIKVFSVILYILVLSQVCSAQLCAKLIDARCGETHTLALAEDGSLWSCGSGPIGLGAISQVSSLQRVKGPNGIGNLNNIIAFDAGLEHSLAVDSNTDYNGFYAEKQAFWA